MSDFNKNRNLKAHLEAIKKQSEDTKKHLQKSIINEIYQLIEEAIFSVSLNHSLFSGVILIPRKEEFFIEEQNDNDKNPAFTTMDLIKNLESSLKNSGITVEHSVIGGSYDEYDDWVWDSLPRPRKMEFCLRIDVNTRLYDDLTTSCGSPVLKTYKRASRGGGKHKIFICDASEEWYWTDYPDGVDVNGGLNEHCYGPYSMLRIIT